PDAPAHRKIQYTAMAAYLAQVKFGGPEPQPERAPEVFNFSQMTALEGVLETLLKAAHPYVAGDLQADMAWSWIAVAHVRLASVDLYPNIDPRGGKCFLLYYKPGLVITAG
ncbi:MAG: hypothetical protein NUV34_07110, partial [Sulfuricaulis sp.]|nr:hypothetical protein [Sulfuricaulis sp.]